MTNTETYFYLVKEFMKAFDQRCYRFTSDVPDKTLKLRADLIDEEDKEYDEARNKGDKIGILDALCDLAYVTAGTMITCGLMPIPYSAKTNKTLVSMDPEASYTIEECRLGIPCHKRMYRYSNRLLAKIDDLGYAMNLIEAFKVVHENNMSKLWTARPDDKELIVIPKGQKFLVKNKNGKVVKPPCHVPPDLSRFIS